ncbi:hypothetical protein EPUS_09024 [Endocarpon pusillum Z07020]|uniref:Thioredoxin-like protein AAED1 n=1 Tax=Endocarpon pusillum (strain Z07020 / HMAS-L-300199) TaxID=1263415 RepID=U1HFS0_ENDPU|nr:uncharacterized protein EPUS_09024 [Endocarpon pusillum Z07020]ERF68970.1 hypothetical protein EPUS_09024 [Endocarpon pusillum Z07020]
MPHDERRLGANSDPATQEFQGDVKVSTALPSESTLERIADLPVFDVDGKTVSFKSLYWSNGNESKKVMIIFIRHFFCGNCQEYLRTLAAAIPPSSLPQDTSIRIIGCGSHTLIPSYIEQTQCPYPIFADPSKRLYSLLGMARTLSLGNKDPDYIRHTLVSGVVKSIAQGLKRIGSGDVLQAGDLKQVGGEFLFEVTGGGTSLTNSKTGNGALQQAEVTWCHRMKNTRDHAELPVLKQVLDLGNAKGDDRRRRSEASWRTSGLARSLSSKRQSLSWSQTRRRSRSTGRKSSHDPKHIHMVNEEARSGDGQTACGHKP